MATCCMPGCEAAGTSVPIIGAIVYVKGVWPIRQFRSYFALPSHPHCDVHVEHANRCPPEELLSLDLFEVLRVRVEEMGQILGPPHHFRLTWKEASSTPDQGAVPRPEFPSRANA